MVQAVYIAADARALSEPHTDPPLTLGLATVPSANINPGKGGGVRVGFEVERRRAFSARARSVVGEECALCSSTTGKTRPEEKAFFFVGVGALASEARASVKEREGGPWQSGGLYS